MGKESKEKAEREAKIAAQRARDSAAAALERELSQKRGRDKRLFFYQKELSSAISDQISAQNTFSSLLETGAALTLASQQKESSWGTLGGIAAGVTGSSAVGAAVAADTMNKNAGIRAHNEAVRQSVFQGMQPGMDAAARASGQAERRKKAIERKMENVKLTLVEERPLEELMGELTFGEPQAAFTQGDTMVIQMKVRSKSAYKIAGGVSAVIDGSFLAEVYAGEEKVGEAYLNFPLHGAEGEVVLKGHCLEAGRGRSYTVLILPIALWLIETYKSEDIPGLNDLIPGYTKGYVWQAIPQRDIPWQRRLEERRLEEERRAEEARQAEEARRRAEEARKKKKKMIAAAVAAGAVVAAVALVLITQARKKQAYYDSGIGLLERGEYDYAIRRFEELGDYKDSPELLQCAQALLPIGELVDEGQYAEAVAQLNGLGSEFDIGAESIKARIYQGAVSLLEVPCPEVKVEREAYYRQMEQCHEMLQALSGYEDSGALLGQLDRRIIGYQRSDSGTISYYRYDDRGRFLDGPFVSCAYDDDRISEYGGLPVTEYDEQGRPARAERDAYSYTSYTFAYDADGRLERTILRRDEGDGSWSGYVETYRYNDDGEVIRHTSSYQDDSGGTGSGLSNYDHTFTYTYDEAGAPVSCHVEDAISGSSWDEIYLYGWIYVPGQGESAAQ